MKYLLILLVLFVVGCNDTQTAIEVRVIRIEESDFRCVHITTYERVSDQVRFKRCGRKLGEVGEVFKIY